jgi:Helix-turn-helix domain
VLAGVSVPYYTRLARGDRSGAAESVLNAIADALRLDDAVRADLFDLARAARPAVAAPCWRGRCPRRRGARAPAGVPSSPWPGSRACSARRRPGGPGAAAELEGTIRPGDARGAARSEAVMSP